MANEVDYGIDFSCVDDFSPMFTMVKGRRVLAESLARRITMDRGSAIDCPDDGIDVRDFLADVADARNSNLIAVAVRGEMLKDARVDDVTVEATLEGGFTEGRTLTLECIVTDAEGPFALTIEVSSVTTKVLLQ